MSSMKEKMHTGELCKMSELYTSVNKQGHDEKCNITDIGKTKI